MIDEILWIQKKQHDIIDSSSNPTVQQTSLAELHRLKITPSNYFYVASDIMSNSTISTTTSPPEAKTTTTDNHIIIV